VRHTPSKLVILVLGAIAHLTPRRPGSLVMAQPPTTPAAAVTAPGGRSGQIRITVVGESDATEFVR
jgi:hypothetical protein